MLHFRGQRQRDKEGHRGTQRDTEGQRQQQEQRIQQQDQELQQLRQQVQQLQLQTHAAAGHYAPRQQDQQGGGRGYSGGGGGGRLGRGGRGRGTRPAQHEDADGGDLGPPAAASSSDSGRPMPSASVGRVLFSPDSQQRALRCGAFQAQRHWDSGGSGSEKDLRVLADLAAAKLMAGSFQPNGPAHLNSSSQAAAASSSSSSSSPLAAEPQNNSSSRSAAAPSSNNGSSPLAAAPQSCSSDSRNCSNQIWQKRSSSSSSSSSNSSSRQHQTAGHCVMALVTLRAAYTVAWITGSKRCIQLRNRPSVVDAATTSPKHHPGWGGGGWYIRNKLACQRVVCTPGWRSSCGRDTVQNCQKKFCRYQSAIQGAVCDISPCVQGNCFKGKCMGKGAATCPSTPDDCTKRVCSLKTGSCSETCPKRNGSPCNGGRGTCQAGVCIPATPRCPMDPNKCQSYTYNNANKTCDLETKSCQQPPGVEYSCQELRCKRRTGLCTAFWKKADGPNGSDDETACE
ncbi:hypothetical protein COO60DRAFT_1640225 [Scenedesmus sp. NREL 46B-D3]|nr:hypothetical protein COO60DRAFT_1640225 [Scenedesmus sp. NREL 46B-D3]